MGKINRTVLHDSVPTITEFSVGGTARTKNDLFIHNHNLYRYKGSFPVVVAPCTKPNESDWELLSPSSTFKSYNALRNATGISDNVVFVLGREGGSTYGSGYFIKSTDTSLTDDDGLVLTDKDLGVWVRAHSGLAYPEWYGAVPDGSTDCTTSINNCLQNKLRLPTQLSVGAYGVTGTIQIKSSQILRGVSSVIEEWAETASGSVIRWISSGTSAGTVVLIGYNQVNDEPTTAVVSAVLENVFIDCNNKVNFGVYGTYLTRDSLVNTVAVSKSLEYGMYFAKSWYSTYTRLISKSARNVGLAFGMPLVYLNKDRINWTSDASLEMNRCKIDNVRSHSSGTYYSVDNPGTFKPNDLSTRFSGYGLGAGIGNSFTLTNFLSEKSGGVNLYYYTENQPVKVVSGGYLEDSCYHSGLDPATSMVNIFIDFSQGNNTQGGSVLRDIFSNYNSGGIMTYKGSAPDRLLTLKNVHQPRFLKDAQGVSSSTDPRYPLNWIKLEQCYYLLSSYNLIGASTVDLFFNLNLNTSWVVPCKAFDIGSTYSVFIRNRSSTWNPVGSLTFTRTDGSTFARSLPTVVETGEWVLLETITNVESVRKSGGTGEAQAIDIKIIKYPSATL